MSYIDKLKDLLTLDAVRFDQQAEGARRRMADFDILTVLQRELANEYGIKVVTTGLRISHEEEVLRRLCENHRATQQELALTAFYGAEAKRVLRNG